MQKTETDKKNCYRDWSAGMYRVVQCSVSHLHTSASSRATIGEYFELLLFPTVARKRRQMKNSIVFDGVRSRGKRCGAKLLLKVSRNANKAARRYPSRIVVRLNLVIIVEFPFSFSLRSRFRLLRLSTHGP